MWRFICSFFFFFCEAVGVTRVVEASNVINDPKCTIKVLSVICFGPKCNKGAKCNMFWP